MDVSQLDSNQEPGQSAGFWGGWILSDQLNEAALRLRLARVEAIEAYNQLEFSMMNLMTNLLEVDQLAGSAVFNRIGSAHARIGIINDLFRIKFRDDHAAFRDSTLKMVRALDGERNKIIHWSIGASGVDGFTESHLVPSNLFSFVYGNRTINEDDLADFSMRCWFVAAHLNFFVLVRQRPEAFEGDADAWRDIFQQPVIYPPQSPHPLYPTFQERRDQQGSSPP